MGDSNAGVKAEILRRYQNAPIDIELSPLRDSSRGQVNHEDADISYHLERRDYHHTGQVFDCLSWEIPGDNVSASTQNSNVIGVGYIAGIHTVGGRASSTYNLIFVDPLPRDKGNHAPALALRTIEVFKPPEDLVSDFLCPEEPSHLFVAPTDGTPNLHIVVSTNIGTDLANNAWCDLLRPLLDHFTLSQRREYSLHYAASRDTILELVTSTLLPRAKRSIAQTIVLLSDDNGLTDLLNALLSTSPFTAAENLSKTHEQEIITPPSSYVKPVLCLLPCGHKNALAHSNFLTSNRISQHSTFGLRALLLGKPEPLPYFQATFSRGAHLITDRGKDGASLRKIRKRARLGDKAESAVDGVPTIHGAVVASWALHASVTVDEASTNSGAPTSRSFRSALEEYLRNEDTVIAPRVYKGNVTLFDSTRHLPISSGWSDGGATEEKQLLRPEHTFLLATCGAFLEEGFEMSPMHRFGSGGIGIVEFGQLYPRGGEETNKEKQGEERKGEGEKEVEGEGEGEERASRIRHDNEIKNIINAAYNGGQHDRDKRVGYHSARGLRIEIPEDQDDERQRQFCVDGMIVAVEKGGWMEVEEVDCYRNGVLDLVGMEWEESELSIGEEQEFAQNGIRSYPVDPALLDERLSESPVDEPR
ncbi:hypothetical protein MBLNU230_g0030t1 [Neophaeotheca triangularis]